MAIAREGDSREGLIFIRHYSVAEEERVISKRRTDTRHADDYLLAYLP
jgi:hypothetical protein